MKFINFMSSAAIPIIMSIIIIYGLLEKNKVYDTFVEGAKEGMEIVVKLFPTLIGIFVAIGALRSSGVLDFIIQTISPITNLFHIPSEIMPLAIVRPISGSASTAVATDIMTRFGVDSNIGLMASTIMGSTETTFYTIAIYTSCVGIKKTRFVLAAALIGDFIRNAIFCNYLWIFVVKFFLTKKKKDSIMFTEFIQGSTIMLIQILLFFIIYFIVREILILYLSKKIQKKISE